jgi:autotransporter-associated beta strand protein
VTGGALAGKGAAIYQSGGTVNLFGDGKNPVATPGNTGIVIGNGAYGYYKVTGGTLNINSTDKPTYQPLNIGINAPAVFDQTGGTVDNLFTDNAVIAASGTSVLNVTGGVFQTRNFTPSQGIILGFGTNISGLPGGTAMLNIGGGPGSALVDTTAGTQGGFVAFAFGDTGKGILNLGTNGVLKAGSVVGCAFIDPSVKGTGIFNFHGGTLAVGTVDLPAGVASFMEGLDNAYIYSEGAIIDTNGKDATIAQNLQSPSGFGIKRIDVGGAGGSGYIGAPVVSIESITGTGSGATAVAVMNGDKIDHFVITNPGIGYQPTDLLNVSLSGGGFATTASATIGTGLNYFAENIGGGLEKIGAGSLTLTGDLTYPGDTTVNEGTLNVNALNTPSATVTVMDGAVLNAVSITADTLIIGGTPNLAAVPEPSTLALLAISGLAALGFARWRL